MPIPADLRRQSISDAMDYLASRIWALEDLAASQIREDVKRAYETLARELVLLFVAYVAGDVWRATDASYRQRTDSFSVTLSVIMTELDKVITQKAYEAALRSYLGGYYGGAWVVSNGVRVYTSVSPGLAGVSVGATPVPHLPTEAIRAAILAPYKGSTFLDRFQNARDEFVTIIKKSVVESQIKGESIAAATRRLRDALGLNRQSPGGYLNRVEMITRTEVIRSSNAGTEAIYKSNRDVLKGVEFKATNDERTCPRCGSLDGKQYLWSEVKPDIPIHPRCRCDYLPVLIDTALENEIVGPRQTYKDWAKANGITQLDDGGVPRMERGKPAPKSPVKESVVYPIRHEQLIVRGA